MKIWFYLLKWKFVLWIAKKVRIREAEILPPDKTQNWPSFGTGRKSLPWNPFWNFLSNFSIKSAWKKSKFLGKIWILSLIYQKIVKNSLITMVLFVFWNLKKIKKIYIDIRMKWWNPKGAKLTQPKICFVNSKKVLIRLSWIFTSW